VFALRARARRPEKAHRFVEMSQRIRTSLSLWAPFVSEAADAGSRDDGAALEGADRQAFRRVTRWLYGCFHALPFDYVLANTPPFRD
jgi:hypothetical protein